MGGFRVGDPVTYRPKRLMGGGMTGYFSEFEAEVIGFGPKRVRIRACLPVWNHFEIVERSVDPGLLSARSTAPPPRLPDEILNFRQPELF